MEALDTNGNEVSIKYSSPARHGIRRIRDGAAGRASSKELLMTLHDEDQERRRKWIVYRPRPVVRSNDAALIWAIITGLAVFGLTVLFSK
mgnify:CR=1 FL=1